MEEIKQTELFDLYKIYRAQEEHENILINARLQVFLTLQAFMFGTFGLVIEKVFIPNNTNNAIVPSNTNNYEYFAAKIFLFMICIVGFSSSRVALHSISAAMFAQSKIREKWQLIEFRSGYKKLPPFAGGGHLEISTKGSTFSSSLPKIHRILWMIIGDVTVSQIFLGFFPTESSNFNVTSIVLSILMSTLLLLFTHICYKQFRKKNK